jgi:hypothetical protein
MVANAIQWPAAIFPRTAMFAKDIPSRSGGLSITGYEQVTVSTAGRWKARLTVPVMTENAVLAARALSAQMQGRAGTILVPKWEMYGVRNGNGRRFEQQGTAQYENPSIGGELNFDGSAFGQEEPTHATLAASASLGATQITVNLLDGEGPRPGQHFGIGNRLHLAANVWQATPEAPTTIRFWPPLRAAAASGARVTIDRPVCLMRFADDSQGELDLDFGRWGNITLELVEAS